MKINLEAQKFSSVFFLTRAKRIVIIRVMIDVVFFLRDCTNTDTVLYITKMCASVFERPPQNSGTVRSVSLETFTRLFQTVLFRKDASNATR